MLQHHFIPESLPPVKTDLVDPAGVPTQDLMTIFQTLEGPEDNSILLIQDKDDLLAWIFENYDKTK
jgi:hypothetical protein